ncbi:MAG: Glu/Leu/Phe/Val dehydrogenase [Planctomycetota bacterium]
MESQSSHLADQGIEPGAMPSTPMLDEETPFATMMASFDEAAARLGLRSEVYQVLRKSDREIAISLPTTLDDGTFHVFDGYRLQHNQGLGPFLGPLRIAADLRIDELRALAAWMTWKCAILGIPFGGSAGGIRVDPAKITTGDLERIVRRYAASLTGDVGPERDVFTPDLYADERVMAWIMDTISTHERCTASSSVTGKPLAMAGSLGSPDAVAQGLDIVLRLACGHYGMHRQGLRINIQGAGTVGGNLARILHADGQIITGISDVSTALFDENGLDIPAILAWREEHGHLAGFPGSHQVLDGKAFITAPCDVLVPCAVANAVHSGNAVQIQAKMIVEGAHGPVSLRADRILDQRGIPVVPDILANGGGVILSYFEWVQNRTGLAWFDGMVNQRLVQKMRDAWSAVIKAQEEHNVSLRHAAHIVAVQRVAEADQARGIFA